MQSSHYKLTAISTALISFDHDLSFCTESPKCNHGLYFINFSAL